MYYLYMENQETPQNNSNPSPAQSSQSSVPGTKPYNLEPNMEAALAYLVPPITGFLVWYYEKENGFIRFHAMQSIIFGIATFVAYVIASATTVILIGLLLVPLVTIASFLLWLMLIWKAYNNEEWEVPYLGKMARDQIK